MMNASDQSLHGSADNFFAALARLASMQREALDRLALQEAVVASSDKGTPDQRLSSVAERLKVSPPKWSDEPDETDLPALVICPDGVWRVLKARNGDGKWVGESFDVVRQRWGECIFSDLGGYRFASLRLLPDYKASDSQVLSLIIDEITSHKSRLFEGVVGGALLTFLGVLVSFYTMQVYDRVIPSGATQTLLVLTMGITVVVVMEYAAKRLRSRVYEHLVDLVDQRLARMVYLRFLSVRLDQMPQSVGSLASQLRGYESVRGFLVGVTTQLLVDAPFALVFLLVIAAIAGPLALVPLAFFIIAIFVGAWHAASVRALMERSQEAANRKTGLLVETVEGAEIIKSGQGGWRMLGRWLASADESRALDLETRRLSEAGQYRTTALQQMAFVSLIALGASLASQGQLTMGGLIACSILSSRVFSPATQLSGLLTQWASVQAALKGLDAIWQLEGDHHGQLQPVHIETLEGSYRFEDVLMSHNGRPALIVPKLSIFAGEKVAIIGPIGSGKTTLLRLLSGMYKPTEGRIWLDDLDIMQIAKPKLAESLGYLPQDGRLLGGTLRENLTLGLPDPGDDHLIAASKATGLYEAVVAAHPQGLQLAIQEGGTGLSGGQRQLVNLTRVFLRKPRVWLLDEPTASLDRMTEQQMVRTLSSALQPEDTMVLVTHKTELLQLADRVIVVAKHQIVMDGPRDQVLAKLRDVNGAGAEQTGHSVEVGK